MSGDVVRSELVENCRRFFQVILQFQRKNGYIFSAWGRLRLIEHQIVLELDRGTLMRAVDLCIRLSQPPANISHVLTSLKRKGLVREIPGDSEREKFLLLSRKGKALANSLDDLSNALMEGLSSGTNDEEQTQVYDLWESVNNALGAPQTLVRAGDHPLRLQTRRFTRIFGYLSKRPGSVLLTYPEAHILDLLADAEEGVMLSRIAHMLHVSESTLKKVVTKLHAQGLCSAPTARKGQRVQIFKEGRELLAQIIGERAQVFADAFSPSLKKRLARVLPTFEKMVANWSPNYSFPEQHLSVYANRPFFKRLQIHHLRMHARHFWALSPELESALHPTSTSLLLERGMTPCFYLSYRTTHDEVFLDDFGCSPSIDWAEAGGILSRVLVEKRAPQSGIVLCTNHMTAPLRTLLCFPSEFGTIFRFADFPTCN